MAEFEEKTSSITVPKNTGPDGFLKTIRGIMNLPRVQTITIEASGTVRYTRFVRNDEVAAPIGVDYAGLEPWAIIRNGDLVELDVEYGLPAPSVMALLFNEVAREGLVPIAIATGSDSQFWQWHLDSSGVRLSNKTAAYGLPIYTDREMPDHVLVLCAAHVRGSLVDCHRFIKTSMATESSAPQTSVQIL